ncbi:transient receptor potential cation channel protein painless [Orussus abietinus]|uniref:transient receptor potential cation channel protein painless n=1 Tax=Orussus abietinus TaxID=222816 RepID=UPI00062662AC|nr:transient receptor potential cation channel protein painless [Orussus abietinus]
MEAEEELFQMQLIREENPSLYKVLLENLRARRFAVFKSLATRALNKYPPSIDINYVFPGFEGKTFLDIACCEGYEEFVRLLLELGADPNRVNKAHNRAPLHFATEAGFPEVVGVLLKDPGINPNLEVARRTPLHIAVRRNDLRCAELLLDRNASPNIPNSKGASALHLAATSGHEEMVRLILCKSRLAPDLDSFKDARKQTTRHVLERQFPDLVLPPRLQGKVDSNLLRYFLDANDQANFTESLAKLEEDVAIDTDELLKIAAEHDLCDAVRELLKREDSSSNRIDAAVCAVKKGHYKVLKELLDFGVDLSSGRLVILACQELAMPCRSGPDHNFDRINCLKLILAQPDVSVRCEDDKGNSPLHYAARAESSEAVRLLLKAGSYIGHGNILGIPPLAHLSPEILSEYLDECLQASKERTDDYEVGFNYQCLMPHTVSLEGEKDLLLTREPEVTVPRTTEMDPLRYIATHGALKHLLKHPLLSSFLYLKWHRIRHALYANFVIYVIFYLLLNTYILCSACSVSEFNATRTNDTVLVDVRPGGGLWSLTLSALIILSIREIVQVISSPCHYVYSLENWLEVTLLGIGFVLLRISSAQLAAVAILLSAWELVILMGQHPRMSTGIEMFKTVSLNFARFLLPYAFLILAFALAFFTLFKDADDPNFPNLGRSLFKTVIMLTGEFEAGEIPFPAHPVLSHLVFVLFVFLIAIVLFNLLNGLAVSDTAEILGKAELVGLICRAKLIGYAESVAVGSPFFGEPKCCCAFVNATRSFRMNPLIFLAKRMLFFPKYIPLGKITVLPYRGNEIRIQGRTLKSRKCNVLRMDRDIVTRAREVLARRGRVSENDKILAELDLVKGRLDKLESLLESIKAALDNNNVGNKEQG